MTFEASYNFIGKMGRWELWGGGGGGGGGGGVNFERVNIEQGILWFRMIFCFLLGFFAFTSAKEFCSMVRNQTLLKI